MARQTDETVSRRECDLRHDGMDNLPERVAALEKWQQAQNGSITRIEKMINGLQKDRWALLVAILFLLIDIIMRMSDRAAATTIGGLVP